MNYKPLISAVIPTYNRFSFLKEAVDSVLSQTFKYIELIISDDGSTDGTDVYGKELALKPGINYISLEHSGMPGKVRNAGAAAASGQYLAFLDSDDIWKLEKLARQMAFFQADPNIKICHTRELWLRNGKVVSQSGQHHSREGDVFTCALKKCIIGPSTVMMKREMFFDIGCFREDLEIAEDYEFWLRVTAEYNVGYIDEPLVIKRAGHPDQLSEKYRQIEIFRIRALEENINAGRFEGQKLRLARMELARKYRIYANGCFKRGKIEEGNRCKELADSLMSSKTGS